jgi:hypothetical protein
MAEKLPLAQVDPVLVEVKARAQKDRRWSTVYWFSHDICTTCAMLSQVVVVFGLAYLVFVPSNTWSKINIYLLIVSFVGFALSGADSALALSHRSRALNKAADTLELALPFRAKGAISDGEFMERLAQAADFRENQMN